jgi:hypothetical protein
METMQKKVRKKIMFIVWKWRDMERVNELIWDEKKFDFYSNHVEEGRGVFFKEYAVEYSEMCPDACIVATPIYNVNENTRRLLDALLEQYACDGNEVMLFLHRSNDYEQQDVDRLLAQFKGRIARCFLFADGRDYLYYKTQKSGILDDVGSFHEQRDPITGDKITIYDGEKIKQPYFDRVWQYYEIEFETKVFQFKEDLFDQWLPFLLPNNTNDISRSALLGALRKEEEPVLEFRLKSFLGKYNSEVISKLDPEENFEDYDALEEESKAIALLEKKEGVSYIFDDCIANLEYQKSQDKEFISEAYEDARYLLDVVLYGPETESVSKATLRDIAVKLDYLVKVIPGELD